MSGIGAVRRVRSVGWVAATACALLCLSPVGARAALTWSPEPAVLDAGMANVSPGLDAVVCPSPSLCVAVDSGGRAVSFDPAAPSGWSAHAIAGGRMLVGVSCPEAGQCTAVDAGGTEISFDPVTGAVSSRVVIDPQARAAIGQPGGQALTGVACPSTVLCVAVDSGGQAISFAPQDPTARRAVALAPSALLSISCPSSLQCTLLTGGGTEPDGTRDEPGLVTLDPGSLAVRNTLQLPTTVALRSLVCPTAGECVAAGLGECVVTSCSMGATLTVDPQTDEIQMLASRSAVGLISLACATSALCTAVDASGAAATFNPASAGDSAQAAVDPLGDWPKGFNGSQIACSSDTSCTLVTWNEPAAITITPQSPAASAPVAIDDGGPIAALACPTPGECVALARVQSKYAPGPQGVLALIEPGSTHHTAATGSLPGAVAALACPSATQCTAITTGFNRRCPSCLARHGSVALTFNPSRPPRGGGVTTIDRARIDGLACPAARQCTAVDIRGREITFDPTERHDRLTHLESDAQLSRSRLTALACPTVTQCTAVGDDGRQLTFLPRSGALLTAGRIDTTRSLTSIACPSINQCTAVDRRGGQVTFDPRRASHRPRRHPIDHAALTGIACPATVLCVAVDGAGSAVSGDPRKAHGWRLNAVPGASSLLAVSCPSTSTCVATDSIGQAFTSDRAVAGPQHRPAQPAAGRWATTTNSLYLK